VLVTGVLAVCGVLAREPLGRVIGIDRLRRGGRDAPHGVAVAAALRAARHARGPRRVPARRRVDCGGGGGAARARGWRWSAPGLGTAGAYLGTPLAMAATAAVLAVLIARRTAVAGDAIATRMRGFAREAVARSSRSRSSRCSRTST
jgi:hypothetical protein